MKVSGLLKVVLSSLILSVPAYSEASSEIVKEKLNFHSKDGTRLYGEFYEALEPKAIMLVIHGLQSHTGWYMSGERNAEAGITSFAFDRRGSGLSDGKHGHADNADNFMDDLDAALSFVKANNSLQLPVHVMANSLGAVVSLNYFSQNRNSGISSLIFTTPGTHSTKEGDYSLLTKLAILTAPADKYFRSPIRDEHFADPGNYLDWIMGDPMSRRNFTASFLRTVNKMKEKLGEKASKIDIPLFALTADKDAIIDNAAFEKEVFSAYKGEKELKSYDSKHYLYFGNDREKVIADIQDWVLAD